MLTFILYSYSLQRPTEKNQPYFALVVKGSPVISQSLPGNIVNRRFLINQKYHLLPGNDWPANRSLGAGWRREGDSNPRSHFREITAFEAAAFVHSAISPHYLLLTKESSCVYDTEFFNFEKFLPPSRFAHWAMQDSALAFAIAPVL